MHHYGGGWADIKHTSADWRPHFDRLRRSDALALGYQEIPDGIPHIKGPLGDELRANYSGNIGLCAFIFKRDNETTAAWLKSLHETLDSLHDKLKNNPATHPQDCTEMALPHGRKSTYPVSWSGILGDIFHPLMYKNRKKILQGHINPLFYGYR
jgi:hypothetical protein